MNGIPFNPENILLKTGNQYLNVDLHVNNRVGHEIFHLSADGIDTDFVNGEKIWEDHTDDTVLVTHRSNDPHMIHGPLHFHEKVIVDNLVFKGGNLFEAQMKDIQLDMGMRKLVEEQTGAFRDLMRTVTKATQQNKGEFMQRWEGGEDPKSYLGRFHSPNGDGTYLLYCSRYQLLIMRPHLHVDKVGPAPRPRIFMVQHD